MKSQVTSSHSTTLRGYPPAPLWWFTLRSIMSDPPAILGVWIHERLTLWPSLTLTLMSLAMSAFTASDYTCQKKPSALRVTSLTEWPPSPKTSWLCSKTRPSRSKKGQLCAIAKTALAVAATLRLTSTLLSMTPMTLITGRWLPPKGGTPSLPAGLR